MSPVTPYFSSQFRVIDNDMYPNTSHETNQMSFQSYNEGYFTLNSSPAATGTYNVFDYPSAISSSLNRSQFSPQGSHSYISDPHHSSDNTYGSPLSGHSSVVDDNTELKNQFRDMEVSLPGAGDSGRRYCSLSHREGSYSSRPNQLMDMVPTMELKQLLFLCAQAISKNDLSTAESLMDALAKRVSVSGSPIERLAAYMLEGLRARMELSGYTIYKKLRCDKPTSSDLLSYMHILYEICPYYKFAYIASNAAIQEALGNKASVIHVIDFQIAMGTQWMLLIQSLAHRPGGPPLVRITGVDDSHSAYVRGGGLEVVGKRLAKVAESCGVPFEFQAAAMSGCQVTRESLKVREEEALVVNFPYMLHHMPDESVSTANHRDRLLRLVKSLSPVIVTLIEQESNSNTPPFLQRFLETLEYYTAMFESIDVALPRDDKKRINAEQHCLARDIVNTVACENAERVERHEPFGKWRARFGMAGFEQLALSPSVSDAIRALMVKYHKNYRVQEWQGALYLGWKERFLATFSVWG